MYPELNELLQYYSETFCNRTCMLKTGYMPLSELQIVFNESDFHHLVGLHKVTRDRASVNIGKIKKQRLTLSMIVKHERFKEIRYRILEFKSLEKMFIDPQCDICVLAKDLRTNSMNIDLILFDEVESDFIMVLGLRRAKDSLVFYPTTLYKAPKNKFKDVRKTKVEMMTWI